MARELKVYRTTAYLRGSGQQMNAIVAATTQKEAVRLLAITPSEFRHSGGITGNTESIEVAMSEPGQVFCKPAAKHGIPYVRWEEQAAAIERKEEIAQRNEERKVQQNETAERNAMLRQRRQEAERAAKEMIADHADMLADYGVTLESVGGGNVQMPMEQLVGLLRRIN